MATHSKTIKQTGVDERCFINQAEGSLVVFHQLIIERNDDFFRIVHFRMTPYTSNRIRILPPEKRHHLLGREGAYFRGDRAPPRLRRLAGVDSAIAAAPRRAGEGVARGPAQHAQFVVRARELPADAVDRDRALHQIRHPVPLGRDLLQRRPDGVRHGGVLRHHLLAAAVFLYRGLEGSDQVLGDGAEQSTAGMFRDGSSSSRKTV